TVSDDQVQQLVRQQLDAGTVPATDGQTVYNVVLPPNVVLQGPGGEADSAHGMGGYHMSFAYNGQHVYYAAIVYSQGGN
ncbi:hypothetical protein ACMWQB_31460, partial [Escherichia coli]|uniref:hypothetical protein n=1 Tax=Escherichia coli TaxID=562 RepID=UPI0039E01AE3